MYNNFNGAEFTMLYGVASHSFCLAYVTRTFFFFSIKLLRNGFARVDT